MLSFVLLLSFLWGAVIAIFAQFTMLGNFVCKRMAWLAGIIACIGNLLILLLATDKQGHIKWWHVAAAFFLTSVPVSFRGIWLDYKYLQDQINDAKDEIAE